jgi:putative IMPACT (imprinted ancient) family translation regulator
VRYDYGLAIYIGRKLEADSYADAVKQATAEAQRVEDTFGKNVKVNVDYVKLAKEEGDGTDTI